MNVLRVRVEGHGVGRFLLTGFFYSVGEFMWGIFLNVVSCKIFSDRKSVEFSNTNMKCI